jgi:hypothetical protein
MKYINCANLTFETSEFLLDNLPTHSALTCAKIRRMIVENADWLYDEVPTEISQMLEANKELSYYVCSPYEVFKLTYDEGSATVIYEDSK